MTARAAELEVDLAAWAAEIEQDPAVRELAVAEPGTAAKTAVKRSLSN
ncbi:hypothetical protein [Georgenia sunbinii]